MNTASPNAPRSLQRAGWWSRFHGPVIAVALAGLLLTGVASALVWQWEKRQAEDKIEERAGTHFLALQTGLDKYIHKMSAIRAFFEASSMITRAEFALFANRLLEGEDAIENFSWAPRVRHDNRAVHEEMARREGVPDYEIKVVSKGKLVRAPDMAEYLPLYYSSVSGAEMRILGIDLLSDAYVGPKVAHARDYDELAVVPEVMLQSRSGTVPGVLFSLPVYRRDAPTDTVESRRQNLIGFAHGAVATGEAIERTLRSSTTAAGLTLYVFSDAEKRDAQPAYVRSSRLAKEPAAPLTLTLTLTQISQMPHAMGSLSAGNVRWFLAAVPLRHGPLYPHYDRTWIVMASGLLLTLLAGLYMLSSVRHARTLYQAKEQMSELARRDALTRLANRRAFNDRLAASFAACRRGAPPFALLYFDLDYFKDINDTQGHPSGDFLLQKVAARVCSLVRAEDVVARFGGDEFAVLQLDATADDATALARRINERLAEPYTIAGNVARISASIGIAQYSPEVKDAETLMVQADLALYRAKADGRNCYRFHNADLDREVHVRVTLAEDLRNAIENDELRLWYQPQVELATGRVIGAETLLRWQHPVRGLLAPGEFIAVAEHTGLIATMGQWVFDEACRQKRAWLDAGLSPGVLAVNFSGKQFKANADLQEFVARTLAKWGLVPSDMEIELTESILMEVAGHHSIALERLRRLGVRLAIDDFGTGYSSLDYLTRYPFHRLKIAQELVLDVVEDARNAAVVRAAIHLAEELGIECMAEGVETAEQAEFLIGAGCRLGQGYYFSRPINAERMTAFLREHGARPTFGAPRKVSKRSSPSRVA